jgi:hypothetical protein
MIRSMRRLPGVALWLPPLVAACGPRLAPLPIPAGLAEAPRDAAVRWADSTRPAEPTDIRFRFRFQDANGSAAGRGRARFAPRDSIRFDIVGPLGMGRASALVIGDSARWTEPEEQIRKLVPNYPLFWAMLGVAREPAPGAVVRGLADRQVTVWQFASGPDTVEYVREDGAEPRLLAEVRQGGTRIGRVETRLGLDGFPVSSRLVVPRPASRLDLSFQQHAKVSSFAPDTWLRPTPAQP